MSEHVSFSLIPFEGIFAFWRHITRLFHWGLSVCERPGEGEEETYWRLVTFYYNPHCTILSGEMDLWNFKLKTRDLVLVLKAPYDSLKFAEKSIFYCYFEQNMHRICIAPVFMSLPMLGSHWDVNSKFRLWNMIDPPPTPTSCTHLLIQLQPKNQLNFYTLFPVKILA